MIKCKQTIKIYYQESLSYHHNWGLLNNKIQHHELKHTLQAMLKELSKNNGIHMSTSKYPKITSQSSSHSWTNNHDKSSSHIFGTN